MNKFKKYLKDNYKRILLIILIICGYIGLLFACKYVNEEIKENATSINVSSDKKTRKYRINEFIELTNIIDMGVLTRTYFGSDSNTITFSKEEDIVGTSLVSSVVGVETELQLTNTTSDSVVISYKMYDLFYQNNIIFTDTILLGGYFTTDKYLANFGQYCYFDIYNNGVALIENGTLSKTMNEKTYLFSIDSFTSINETVPYNYDLNLRFDFSRSTATTTNIKFSFYLFAYNLSELISDSYLDGYNDAILDNKDLWYQEGYVEGYNLKTFGGLNYLDYVQFTIDEEDREFDKEYLIDNNYLTNGGLYLSKLGEELGLGYSSSSIHIYFNDLPNNYLNLLFNVFGNDNDYINVIVSSNYGESQFSFDSYVNNKLILTPELFTSSFLIDEIEINYNNLENVGSIINLNDGYNDGYTNGYTNGYNNGLNVGEINGENKVLNNLGQYDLYDREQYLNYGESQKEIGIDIGQTRGCSVNNLFFAIADIPTRILSSLLSFELFGINMFVAFGSIATLLLIIWVIRKVK